jgi:hypothetical protein
MKVEQWVGRRGNDWPGALSDVCRTEDVREALGERPAHVEAC